jgi:hypothetical protein
MNWIKALVVRQVDAEVQVARTSTLTGRESKDAATQAVLVKQARKAVHRARVAREDLEGSDNWRGAGQQKAGRRG